MELSQAGSPKESIEKYWSQQATEYDHHFGHGIGSAKEKELWLDLLERNVSKGKKIKILDVGCGTGFLSLLLSELGCDVAGIDLSATMRAEAQRKAQKMGLSLTLLPGDAEAPDFPDESFDVIISRHVVWTLPEPSKALSNWKRLLKPNGRVVIIDGVWISKKFFRRIQYFFVDLIRWIKGSAHHSGWKKKYVKDLSLLPFFGGAEPEKILELLRSVGFNNIRHDPMEAILSYELRHGPLEYRMAYAKNRRYLISGLKSIVS
ncbi:MAG: methyltransferase domain-containing protein [Desulfobacteraceae bacterium]|jgi:ubiquinone/menaquinone biosynthesis C-methylase UbiE